MTVKSEQSAGVRNRANSNWCYHKINGETADSLLKTHGFDGAFLLRPSSRSDSDEPRVLSVLFQSNVIHIKILCTGDFYQLEGDTEQFASVFDIVDHYRNGRNLLSLSNSLTVKLTQPFLADSKDFLEDRWFHRNISSKMANQLLKEEPLGSFLVRLSSHSEPNYVISMTGPQKTVFHVKIRRHDQKDDRKYFVSPDSSFSSVAEAVSFYRTHAMVDSNDVHHQLRRPLNSSSVQATTIKKRINDLGHADKDGGGFSEEYMQLSKFETDGLQKKKTEGFKAANRPKNRFKNILPYDDTRVVLKDLTSTQLTDYINANHIKPELKVTGHNEYIASQGPLNSTVSDFWRMIWQQNVRFIVMTTKEIEGGKSKCARYWASKEEPVKTVAVGDANFTIRFKEETLRHDYTLTRMELSLSCSHDPPRTVLHYQFLAWPDHSVPQDPNSVLRLLLDLNDQVARVRANPSYRGPQAPIVVHCSAGIGRTGTFIVLDILIHQLRSIGVTSDVDIFRATRNLRTQRPGMIQTESQYKFVYMAVLRFIESLTNQDKTTDEVYCEYA